MSSADPIKAAQQDAIDQIDGILFQMYLLGVDKAKGKLTPGIHDLMEEALMTLESLGRHPLTGSMPINEATRMIVLYLCEAFDFGFANSQDFNERGITSPDLLQPDFRRLQEKAKEYLRDLH